MNNISKIIPALILLIGIFLWIKDCNVTHKKVIDDDIQSQKIATAIIESKITDKSGKEIYNYSFYIDSIKYSGSTNAKLNKARGNKISIYYLVNNPSSNYYIDKNDATYTFSIFDILVGLILALIAFIYLGKVRLQKGK